MGVKALFLDRDGVINIDYGYVYRIEDFHFVKGILSTILAAQKRGYLPIVVTNQSGIARGYYSLKDFESLSRYMIEQMRLFGIDMSRRQLFFCPHGPNDGCNCRKPRAGMLLEAKERFDIDMDSSIMIGDKPSDIQAAKAAGVGRAILHHSNQALNWREIDGF